MKKKEEEKSGKSKTKKKTQNKVKTTTRTAEGEEAAAMVKAAWKADETALELAVDASLLAAVKELHPKSVLAFANYFAENILGEALDMAQVPHCLSSVTVSFV